MNNTKSKDQFIPAVEFVAQTKLPTSGGNISIRAYRNAYDGSEPLALFYTDPSGQENVPVRVHDACMTSEIFAFRLLRLDQLTICASKCPSAPTRSLLSRHSAIFL